MIKINSDISIHKIQQLYHELERRSNSAVDIFLPKSFDKSEFSVFFSFLQFLATWIRRDKLGKLFLPVNSDEEAIAYLNNNEFVYPSIVLSWEKEILDKNGKSLKSVLKEPSKKYFERMDFFELKNNLSIPIFCFDHDKSNRGLSKHFYNSSKDFVSEDVLGFNLFRAYKKIISYSLAVVRDNLRPNLESFNAIIHELFSNTHEHAKTNELDHYLYPNIRAIQIKFHTKKLKNFIEDYRDFSGLVDYLNSGFNMNQQDVLYMIEISILDSGPGLVKRYKRISEYNLTINEEIESIKECLVRHKTSEAGLINKVKGLGLDRVLQTIDGKGFVRIKSGRADIFRDMKTRRYTQSREASDIILYDWKTNSTTDFTIYPPVEGTLISIFYPLDFPKQ